MSFLFFTKLILANKSIILKLIRPCYTAVEGDKASLKPKEQNIHRERRTDLEDIFVACSKIATKRLQPQKNTIVFQGAAQWQIKPPSKTPMKEH